MSRIRVAAVLEAYSITGPAKNLLEFARLAEAEVDLSIVTFLRGQTSNLFIETARRQGIRVETIQETGAYDRKASQALSETVRGLNPQIVQTHAVKSHFLARRTALHRVAPWVAFHHGYTWPSLRARAYNQLDRWSLRAARHVITVSGPFRDELIATGVPPGRVEILHNAIAANWEAVARTPEAALQLREQLGIPETRPVILIVGRLSREKDHLTLLEAVERLRETFAPHLVIVGEGPERPRIEQRIQELKMEPWVTLAGQQSSAGSFYGIANVAVLSSLSEGSPNALLEAMAANVPVVATRVGGIPEIVTHEDSALLVNPGDTTQLSAAIDRVLADARFAKSLAARAGELVRERHDPHARARRLTVMYTTLLQR